jgi:glycosyltransferase involved in cell wall biosynthesis
MPITIAGVSLQSVAKNRSTACYSHAVSICYTFMKMRIVIATGIYPPDIGGPALYAKGVREALERSGHKVRIVTFGNVRSWPSGLRHVAYACKLFAAAWRADVMLAFDSYSTGVPAVFVATILRLPVVVRVGGDFVWEHYIERTEALVPLPHFYASKPKLSILERVAFFLVRWMLARTELAFNTQWLLDIWQPVYGFSRERAQVIGNVLPERREPEESDKTILLYGRSIALKNVQTFRRAYARARKRGLPLALEQRIVPHGQFLERIRRAHAVAIPSVSDVAPNTLLEALSCGKPFLLTKYSGYAEEYKKYGVIMDPLDEESIAQGLEQLADEKHYKKLCANIRHLDAARTYDDVAREMLELVVPSTERGVRVLQLGSDRSKRGVLFRGTPAYGRQAAYAKAFGHLDIIGLSLKRDGAEEIEDGALRIFPTNSSGKWSYLFGALRISRTLLRPHVVSVQDPFEVGLIGWLVASRLRVPLHVQVHTDFLSPEYASHSVMNRARALIAGFVLRRAAGVRVVSESIRASIEKQYHLHAPVSVLPIFADVARLRGIVAESDLEARFAQYDKRLLVVSRLEPEKNVVLALDSFAKSAPQNSCLIVVGDGGERQILEERAKGLGIVDRVHFEGTQNASRYYSIADLVLVPSRYEGYGLVIVEALAAGKPVIATDVGVAREAGAIVTSQEKFADSLKEWFESGPRTGELKGYPYATFDDYVRAYRDDIAACIKRL